MESNTDIELKIKEKFSQFNTQQLIKMFDNQYQFKKIDNCFIIYQILKQRNPALIPFPLKQKYQQLRKINQKLKQCFSHFKQQKKQWKVQKFQNNSVSSKIVNKSQIIMLLEGQLDINFFKLATMIYDVAKYNQWFPFCKQSEDILTVGLAQKFVFLKFQMPFLSSRQAFFVGQALDRIETRNLINLYCESITQNEEIQKKFNVKLRVNEKATVLKLKYLSVELLMIQPGKYDFKMYIHVDINVQIIPEFVLNFFSKKFGQILFNKMIKRANSLSINDFQQKLKQKKINFYHWLDLTNKYWENKYNQQKNNKKQNTPKKIGLSLSNKK